MLSPRSVELLRRLDLFPIVPKDIIEKTNTGGCFTVLIFLSLTWLIISEVAAFMTTEIVSELVVEQPESSSHMVELLSIKLNVTFPYCACHVLSVETQDTLGMITTDLGSGYEKRIQRMKKVGKSKISNIIEKQKLNRPYVFKNRLIRKGRKIVKVKFKKVNATLLTVDQIKRNSSIIAREGCEVKAFMYIRKIPGNLHISTYTYSDVVDILYEEPPDLSHRIESFEFGRTHPNLHLHSSSFAPLDGYISRRPKSSNGSVSFEYYLKVVPTRYDMHRQRNTVQEAYSPNFLGGPSSGMRAWQFTSSANSNIGRYNFPAVYFRYDFSPLTVIYTEKSESVSKFLAQLLAIIGAYLSLAIFCVFLLNRSLPRLLVKLAGKNR